MLATNTRSVTAHFDFSSEPGGWLRSPNSIPRVSSYPAARAELEHIIREGLIEPHFQPIVDLFSGEIYGYEMLSRAPAPFQNPLYLFQKALEWGLAWELEIACLNAAFKKIEYFLPEMYGSKFFLNISPHIFSHPRFEKEFAEFHLQERFGQDHQRFVFEITETTPIHDYPSFRETLQHYRGQGFNIALDDFGAGHSSLVALVGVSPNYVKLDRAIVANIQAESYKQHLLRSVISFTSNVESKLIAEGIETVEELETLVRLGIRYGQGFFLARPEPDPRDLKAKVQGTLRQVFDQLHCPLVSTEHSIASMTLRPPCFAARTMTCEELDRFFRNNPAVDHVVVVADDFPLGVITRQLFYSRGSGQFGFSLIQKKYIEVLCPSDPLAVNERMEVSTLGRLAMNRSHEDLYDPVIVTNSVGKFVGSITMKQLLNQFIHVEVQTATDRNPLTNLPGNHAIELWLREAMEAAPFTVVYADLDHFKEYNDVYGFAQGDRMIKVAAQALSEHPSLKPYLVKTGHIGGDDFVLVSRNVLPETVLQSLCETFEALKIPLFRSEDVEAGFYQAENREGKTVDLPLVTLSLAVISSDNLRGPSSLEQISVLAASLKKRIKALNAQTRTSGFLMDRRTYL